jgi:lambda repressor-like predicted transcriptional regulator
VAAGYENVGRVEEYSSSETFVIAIAAETRLRRRITKRTVEKEATVERQVVRTAGCHPHNLRKHFQKPTRKTETVVAVTILQEWLEKEDAVDFVEKVGLPWPRAREMVLHYLDFVRPLYDRSMHASHVTVV